MPRFVIDCSGLESIGELWERYVRVVEPDGAHDFGRNLDAFWDAVSAAGPGWPGEDAELVFVGSRELDRFMSGSGRTYLSHMREIASDSKSTKVTLL